MSQKTEIFMGISLGMSAGLVLIDMSNVWSDDLDLFDIPPYIAPAVSPNLLVSIDNADSMYWAFSPASLGLRKQQKLHATKSSHYNRLYYNPDRYYPPPRDVTGNLLPHGDFFAAKETLIFFDVEKNLEKVERKSTKQSRSASHATIRNLAIDYMPRWTENPDDRFPDQAPDDSDKTRQGAAYYYSYMPHSNASLCQGNEAQKRLNNACYGFIKVAHNSGPLRKRPELGGRISRDERSNFANWYQYYSSKVRVTKTVLSHWISPAQTTAHIRLARQSLLSAAPQSGDVQAPHTTVKTFTLAERKHFFRWLDTLSPSVEANLGVHHLLQQAGGFFSASGRASAYRERPWSADESGEEASCRLNYHLLVTDGLSNYRDDTFPLHQDDLNVRLPDGMNYSSSRQPLYADRQSATLADWSFNSWATDLRPDLFDNITPLTSPAYEASSSYWHPQSDPARWQHMVNHVLLVGERGLIPPHSASVLEQLQQGLPFHNTDRDMQQGWTLFGDDPMHDPARMDDLYHASVNSRGRFFSWPESLTDNDFSRANSNVLSKGVALAPMRYALPDTIINTSRTVAGNVLYQAQLDGRTGGGRLQAWSLEEFDREVESNSSSTFPFWDAYEINRLRDHQDKIIIGYDPDKSLSDRGVRVFDPDFKVYLQREMTETPAYVEKLLGYIQGVQTQEQRFGGIFRNRQNAVLGSIVNSVPHYVGRGFSAYPDALEAHGQTYREFVCESPVDGNNDERIDRCSRGIFNRKPLLYVGSNDGLLHAFDARQQGGGRELFSYLPALMIPRLKRIADPDLSQVAGVDGPVTSADVFYGGRWHTVLIGGLRTGGQGYFALDITDPDTLAANHPEQLARWEFGEQQDADQGYSFSIPVIAKSNYQTRGSNGRWVAIWGNGYNSQIVDGWGGSGEAVLFVVDIETGALIKKIRTASGNAENPNGLSSPAVVFNNSGFTADFVYAGDVQGNLWKFDISSANPDDWQVAYGEHLAQQDSPRYAPQPLFKAKLDGRSQAITAAPMLSRHPEGKGGLLIYFGTGAYLEKSAQADLTPQSFYAIWDRNKCRQNSTTVDCSTLEGPLRQVYDAASRADLQEQHFSSVQPVRRSVSAYQVDWDTQRGWFVDFPEPGERVIGQAQLQGELVLFSTLVPSGDLCLKGAHGWLMALDKSSGGNPRQAPFTDRDNETQETTQVQSGGASVGIKQNNPQSVILQKECGNGSCLLGDAIEQLEDGTQLGRRRWQVLQD